MIEAEARLRLDRDHRMERRGEKLDKLTNGP